MRFVVALLCCFFFPIYSAAVESLKKDCERYFETQPEYRDHVMGVLIRTARSIAGDDSLGCDALPKYMMKIKELRFYGNPGAGLGLPSVPRLSLDPLVHLPELEILDLTDMEEIYDMSPISKMTNLKWLSLNHAEEPNNEGIEDFKILEPLVNLEYLDISGHKAKSYEPLLKLKKLRSLRLGWINGADMKGYSTLSPLGIRVISFSAIPENFDPTELLKFTNLEELILSNTSMTDQKLEFVSNLSRLRKLDVANYDYGSRNNLTHLSAVKGLNLEVLNAHAQEKGFTDISAVKELTHLKELTIGPVNTEDLSALSGLKQLQVLQIQSPQLQNVSLLGEMSELRKLTISRAKVSDVSALKNLTELTELDISANQIKDLSPLKATKLKLLKAANNPVANIEDLARLPLELVDLRGSAVEDASPLGQVKSLRTAILSDTKIKAWNSDEWPSKSESVEVLALDGNQIEEVKGFSVLKKLKYLMIEQNKIKDITPLAELSAIEYLFLGLNQISDVTPLASLSTLQELTLWKQRGTEPLTSLAPLSKLPDRAMAMKGTLWRELRELDLPKLRYSSNPEYLAENNQIAKTEAACPCKTGNINLRDLCRRHRYGLQENAGKAECGL